MQTKNITIIGGGQGTSVVLSGLKGSGHKLSAIVSMADNGGSTGRLRDQLGVSAVGDLRQSLVATAQKHEVADMFSYRFDQGELSGHNLGNLILAAAELKTGSLSQGIAIAKELLDAQAEVIPVSDDNFQLKLQLNGDDTTGVFEIAKVNLEGEKPDLSLYPSAKLSDSAERAITSSDLIIIAPGNFYCSIIPALLVETLVETVNRSKAKVVFICNLVNRNSQTAGYTPESYLEEINRLAGELKVDFVVYNTAAIPPDCLREDETPVGPAPQKDEPYELIAQDIADNQKPETTSGDQIASIRSLARHDKKKLAEVLITITDKI